MTSANGPASQGDKPPFERLGGYEVLAPISEGGMASVWLGRSNAHPEQLVALKVIRAEYGRNRDFVAMFVDEMRIASRLSHPNVVSMREVGHDGTRHFLAMEVLRGHTLLAVRKAAHEKGKRLPWEVAAWIGARIADALHYAHELVDPEGRPEHVVHRDVNPANIFITREGVPKLIDFGLAKARDRVASTAIGVVKGKVAYLSPEQALGHAVDRRSDIFALGVTLWELTLDRRLFLADTDVETIRRVREGKVPEPTTLLADYPRALADAVLRALAREPKERWQTAAELRDALDAFVASTGRTVDESSVRAQLAELLGEEPPAPWERWVEEAAADKEKTRVWEGAHGEPAPATPQPAAAGARPGRRLPGMPVAMPPRLLTIAAACGLTGALVVAMAVRGCRPGDGGRGLDQRVARIEALLGLEDSGATASADQPPAAGAQAGAAASDARPAQCAVAKITAYLAWQEALAKAKVSASVAESACTSFWSDRKKQACYYAATSGVRTAQAARDATIAGGAIARDAVKDVKDDPKNDAIARARASSEAASTACDDDAGS